MATGGASGAAAKGTPERSVTGGRIGTSASGKGGAAGTSAGGKGGAAGASVGKGGAAGTSVASGKGGAAGMGVASGKGGAAGAPVVTIGKGGAAGSREASGKGGAAGIVSDRGEAAQADREGGEAGKAGAGGAGGQGGKAAASAQGGAGGKAGKLLPNDKPTQPIVVEAEAIDNKDGGVTGPDYAAAARRARGGGGNAPALPPPPTAAIPGGPLPIAGSKVDFEARRVGRFVDEGGATMIGRVVDADSGGPVEDAAVEAWMGTKSIRAETDKGGYFRFDGLVPGSKITLWLTATSKYVQERIESLIPANKDSIEPTFKLLPRTAGSGGRSGGIGAFLSRRSSRTVISGLDAFGPAERAGLAINDAIIAIGKRDVADLGPGAIEYLLRGTIGEEIELTIANPNGGTRRLTLKRSSR